MANQDLGTPTAGSKMSDLNGDSKNNNHMSCFDARTLLVPTLTAAVPVSAVMAEVESNRRPRGRPAGSKKKLKPPIIVSRDSGNALEAHAVEVRSGCDVVEGIANFARRKQCGVCILSGSGCVTKVSLRQLGPSGTIVTLDGQFEILSLMGSFLPPPAPPGVTGFTIYLAGAQGQVIGGGIVGSLIASGPVVIMAATFVNATFDRLPMDEGEVGSHYQHHPSHHHHLEVLNMYGLPPELYSWALGCQLTKS
ncbi:AT-hook motif nuclear-localized protein 16-like [Magnolia sinica]|uniref:AT-hook motif nuclear-localized protein 16-like n=1 Tax=Magnolia sinica TaxID=86752 RepID=UPI002657CC21|nr:AT-hook motif nuclear-localized protein 16-like [Magnolia sinica]